MNHTRFPKEDHLPDWARRDNKITKGDRVEQDCQPLAPVQNSATLLIAEYRFHVQFIVEGTYSFVQRSVIFFTLHLSALS